YAFLYDRRHSISTTSDISSLPGPGTSYAQPTVDITVTQLDIVIDPGCHATAHFAWNGTQFSKRDGFLRFVLVEVANDQIEVASAFIPIDVGTMGGAGEFSTGLVVVSKSDTFYQWHLEFYKAIGKNLDPGDRHGKFLLDYPGASGECPSG
ncbi:MAG: hypothetical protein O2913_14005, partial [Chloroflexi bacterium]|nr:hypothetical protein [Chloroflexota bacterium]